MAENQEKSTRGGLDLSGASDVEARRAFLKGCAKYAVAMPPAVTLLLSANHANSVPPAAACSFPLIPLGTPSGQCGLPDDSVTSSGGYSQEDLEYLQNR